MRICSFLPSATEILFALGLGESVSGVTFECDYPPEATAKPIVVTTILRHGLTPKEIDRQVSEASANGESLYRVDVERLRAIQPDLIVTQELCDVCAIGGSHLEKALSRLLSRPEVLCLTPHSLEDVFADIERIGSATGRAAEAEALVCSLRERVDRVAAGARTQQPRVACLEWLSPPFDGGHWIPQMVALAGGIDPLGTPGEDSRRMPWQRLVDADPEVILAMPCGYDLDRAIAEFHKTQLPPAWEAIAAVRNGRVYAVHANAYFSRPGPRLVTGLEIMRALLQDDYSLALPAHSWARL